MFLSPISHYPLGELGNTPPIMPAAHEWDLSDLSLLFSGLCIFIGVLGLALIIRRFIERLKQSRMSRASLSRGVPLLPPSQQGRRSPNRPTTNQPWLNRTLLVPVTGQTPRCLPPPRRPVYTNMASLPPAYDQIYNGLLETGQMLATHPALAYPQTPPSAYSRGATQGPAEHQNGHTHPQEPPSIRNTHGP